MPVILAIWEAEIGRIKIQGQSRQNTGKTSSQLVAGGSDMCLSSQVKQETESR
jgi:hypothetical protein